MKIKKITLVILVVAIILIFKIAIFASTRVGIDGQYSDLVVNTGYTYSCTASGFEGSNLTYSWGNGATTKDTVYTFSSPGSYMIYVSVEDEYGNKKSTLMYVCVINVEANKEPIANITGPNSGAVSQTLTFDASSSYDTDGYIDKYYFYQVGNQPARFSTNPTFSCSFQEAGGYYVRVRVYDNEGATDIASKYVNIQNANQSPTASISGGSSAYVGESLYLSAKNSFDLDGEITSYSWVGTNSHATTSDYVYAKWTTTGIKTVKLYVTDDDGATTIATKSITVTLRPNNSPVAQITGGSETNIGEGIILSGINSYDTDGYITRYYWSSQTAAISNCNSSSPTFTYLTTGEKTVYLTVTDNNGSTHMVSKNITVKESVNQEPVALISGNSEVGINEGIMLLGEGSYDPDGGIEAFSWAAIGANKATSNSANETFTWQNTGEKTIYLTVTDNEGLKNTKTKKVLVKDYENEPKAYINALDSTFTETDVYFKAQNINGEIEKCEWKFASPSDNIISTDLTYFKKWEYTQHGTYTIYLRIYENGVWSDWTSKIIEIKEGITFEKDNEYTKRSIKDTEIDFLDEVWGIESNKLLKGNWYEINIEIFWDKGLIVYGDYTLDGDGINEFSIGSEKKPYFYKNGVWGEYRYLGMNISGGYYSNQNYISSYYLNLGDNPNANLIKYSNMPIETKIDLNIDNLDNSKLVSLRDDINTKTLHFENNNAANNPNPLILSNIFNQSNKAFDPFSYGIINGMDKNIGGSIRMFFEYKNNGGYDYRTFEGELNSNLQLPSIYITDTFDDIYTLKKEDDTINIDENVKLTINDNKKIYEQNETLSYYYTREDNNNRYLNISDNLNLSETIVESDREDNNNLYLEKDICININRNNLEDGYNYFTYSVNGGITFTNNRQVSENYTISFIINKISGDEAKVMTNEAELNGSVLNISATVLNKGNPKASQVGVYIGGSVDSYIPLESEDVIEKRYEGTYEGLLASNETYLYKAYILQEGSMIYGDEKSIKIPSHEYKRAEIITKEATDITKNSSRLNMEILDKGSYPQAEYIFMELNDEEFLVCTDDLENKEYSFEIDELEVNTLYKYNFYTIQNSISIYGEEKEFKTNKDTRDAPLKPIVTNITKTSAIISSSDDSLVVCNNKTKESGSTFYGLTPNTNYDTYAYFPETDYFKRSLNSETTTFKTLRNELFIYPTNPHVYDTIRTYEISGGDESYDSEIEIIDLDKATLVDDLTVKALSGTGSYLMKVIRGSDSEIFEIELEKAIKEAPSIPKATDITTNSAILSSDDKSLVVCESVEKESGSMFDGLIQDTQYEMYAYYPEDNNYLRSLNSQIGRFKTKIEYSGPEYSLYIDKIYDPDFQDYDMIPVYNKPIIEDYSGRTINIGYRIDFICHYQNNPPFFDELEFFDYNANEIYPYEVSNNGLIRREISVLDYEILPSYVKFSVYVDPTYRFYYEKNNADMFSRRVIDEALVVVSFDKDELIEPEHEYKYIWKEIDINETPLFWYNLQENSFSDIY